jgi:hypothetical protein
VVEVCILSKSSLTEVCFPREVCLGEVRTLYEGRLTKVSMLCEGCVLEVCILREGRLAEVSILREDGTVKPAVRQNLSLSHIESREYKAFEVCLPVLTVGQDSLKLQVEFIEERSLLLTQIVRVHQTHWCPVYIPLSVVERSPAGRFIKTHYDPTAHFAGSASRYRTSAGFDLELPSHNAAVYQCRV